MPNQFTHGGFIYHVNGTNNEVEYYRCARFHSEDCKARAKIRDGCVITSGEHVCKTTVPKEVDNGENFVMQLIAREAGDMAKYPAQIYGMIVSDITKSRDLTARIPSKQEVYNKIRTIRGDMTNWLLDVQKVHYSTTLRATVFRRRLWIGDIDGRESMFVLWASDHALSILHMESQIFVDATFKATPHPFSQCLIVMAHDLSTNINVPCVYVLMTSKSEYLYWVELQLMTTNPCTRKVNRQVHIRILPLLFWYSR
jgi:hypothetical protein